VDGLWRWWLRVLRPTTRTSLHPRLGIAGQGGRHGSRTGRRARARVENANRRTEIAPRGFVL